MPLIDFLKAFFLGIIEGITEFLPISSTGHLILANQWVTFQKEFTFLFDIFIQLGAILAVIVYFFVRLWPFQKTLREKKETLCLWQKVTWGVTPALFLGFLLNNWIEEKMFNPLTVVTTLIVGGIILIWLENHPRPVKFDSIEKLNYSTVFFIGLFQCLAMIPGTSRSAATILGAIFLGASRKVATEFSFFLAIPTILAASVFSLIKHGLLLSSLDSLVLFFGFSISFIVALVVIKYFLLYIQKNNLKIFGYYRIILGIIILITFLI